MRVTIIPEDNLVSIDGEVKHLNFEVNPNIRAVQWYETHGTVEQVSGGSRWITSLSEFSSVINAFNTPPEEPALTLLELKALKLSQLASYRYQVEMGGTMVGGILVATNDRAKTMLAGARTAAEEALNNDQPYSINWKTADGWIVLDAATIIMISNSVRSFIQDCFDNEKAHYESIENLTTAESVESYDFTTGWPN